MYSNRPDLFLYKNFAYTTPLETCIVQFFFSVTWENKTVLIVWDYWWRCFFLLYNLPSSSGFAFPHSSGFRCRAHILSFFSSLFQFYLCLVPAPLCSLASVLNSLPVSPSSAFFLPFLPPVLLRNSDFWWSVGDILVYSNIVMFPMLLCHSCSWSGHLTAEERRIF